MKTILGVWFCGNSLGTMYQNTFIKDLDVTDNDLDDLVAVPRLLCQNKTITRLCLDREYLWKQRCR
jgi:hypothetical protein